MMIGMIAMFYWGLFMFVSLGLVTLGIADGPMSLFFGAMITLVALMPAIAWVEKRLEREPPRSAFPGKLTIAWWDEHRDGP